MKEFSKSGHKCSPTISTPDYFSTKWALQQTVEQRIGVQHHHAHIASCMAENRLDGPVIGFALDGTGYGTDGNIWGGEVLIADYDNFERAAHFENVIPTAWYPPGTVD